MKRGKRLLITGLTALSLVLSWGGLQAAGVVSADSTTDTKNSACAAIGGTVVNGVCNSTNGPSLNNTVTIIVNTLSVIIGVVAVIMIVVGGFKYITSNGDSGNLSSAKNTIVYAIIGLIIVAFAQAIVRFVINTEINPPGKQKPVKAAIIELV